MQGMPRISHTCTAGLLGTHLFSASPVHRPCSSDLCMLCLDAVRRASGVAGSAPCALHLATASHASLQQCRGRTGARAELGEDGLLSSREPDTLVAWCGTAAAM